MTTLTEAAENIARMEAAYKATGIPQAPDTPPTDKPSERVENAALGVGLYTIAAVFAGWLT